MHAIHRRSFLKQSLTTGAEVEMVQLGQIEEALARSD